MGSLKRNETKIRNVTRNKGIQDMTKVCDMGTGLSRCVLKDGKVQFYNLGENLILPK